MKPSNSRVLAFVLIGASFVGVGMSVVTQIQQHEAEEQRAIYETCSDEVLNQLVQVLNDTRDVGAQERNTTKQLYIDIRDNPRGFNSRMTAYLEQLDKAEAERNKRPLPLPPRVACGTAEQPAAVPAAPR
jgi:hypothetical protein